MDIEQTVVYVINNDSAIQRLIKGRFRPIAAAQWDVRPYVGYYPTVPDEQFDHYGGDATTRRIEFTFEITGDTFQQVKQISAAFRSALHSRASLTHSLNGLTIEDIQFAWGKHNGDSDLSEPPDVGNANPIKRISSQYLILYREV